MNIISNLYRTMALQAVGGIASVQWGPTRKFGNLWLDQASAPDRVGIFQTGFAIDPNRKDASLKALMEVLEALAIKDAGADFKLESRSGVAAHFNQESARESGYRELVERDAILFHWLSESPGGPLPADVVNEARRSFEFLKETGDVQLVALQSADRRLLVSAAGSRRSSGCWYLGWGCADSQINATHKAMLEWAKNVEIHLRMGGCPLEKLSISDGDPLIKRRMEFGIHHLDTKISANSALLDHLFSGREPLTPISDEQSVARSESVYVSLPTRSTKYCVEYVQHPRLLKISFGETFGKNVGIYFQSPRLSAIQHSRHKFHPVGGWLRHPLD